MGKRGIQNPTDEQYNNYVNLFKSISQELERPIKEIELKDYNLPSARWFVKHSKDDRVTNFNTFIEYEIEMVPRYEISKEYAIDYILKLQNSLSRPLKKSDLKGVANNSIGEGVIKRYWGNFSNMKKRT